MRFHTSSVRRDLLIFMKVFPEEIFRNRDNLPFLTEKMRRCFCFCRPHRLKDKKAQGGLNSVFWINKNETKRGQPNLHKIAEYRILSKSVLYDAINIQKIQNKWQKSKPSNFLSQTSCQKIWPKKYYFQTNIIFDKNGIN